MQLADITNAFVEDCLRSVHGSQQPSEQVLQLCMLDRSAGSSAEACMLHLQELLHDLVWESYRAVRKAEMLSPDTPATRSEILEQIAEDFNRGNSELESWSALYYRYLSVVRLSVEELSSTACMVPQQFRRRINQGLSILTQRLRRLEMQAQHLQKTTGQTLPVPEFTHLIGADPYFETLTSLFRDSAGPRLVSLEGIGGLGKTALARAFVSLPETRQHWHNILWISARQYFMAEDGRVTSLAENDTTLDDITARLTEHLGMEHLASKPISDRLEGIQAALNLEAYLIVVDNLETVEEYIQLIPALAKCAGRSRFLITTRQTLRQFSYVHTIQLSELNFDAACELMEAEHTRRGRLASAFSKELCKELYQLVGGLPLAIKLVAAQLLLRPLEEILTGFRNAQGGMDNLYRYLYWQTWQLLDDPARRLLLSFLPADPEGEDLDFIQMMSDLTPEVFFAALHELDEFSLLEISGGAQSPRYRLHRLTVTFLQTDILSSWTEID